MMCGSEFARKDVRVGDDNLFGHVDGLGKESSDAGVAFSVFERHVKTTTNKQTRGSDVASRSLI
jgi:hypothetical protein